MNATDLMLGDYVQIENEEGNLIIDYICDIGYVPQWNELGVRTCKCGNEWLRESEIMPLPLTAKILRENGFKEWNIWSNKSYRWEYAEGIYINIDFTVKEPWTRISNRRYFATPICRYVHELQHALKLCGINKEIIL